jgi:DNA adenine methylase
MRESRDLAALAVATLAFYAYNTSFAVSHNKRGFAYSIRPDRNETKLFTSRIAAILKHAAAWRDVTIENLDFRQVIKRYDSPRTVFYLDPP